MTGIKRERLDVLFAFKAIALSGMSGTEKSVTATIIDSHNHRTTQCDPSFNRVAHLLNVSRRTVIRAVIRAERERFLRKIRHGGRFHRNSYEPNWPMYRELERAWAARRKTRHWKLVVPETSPSGSQSCHPVGDPADTQTSLINQSKKPAVAHSADCCVDGGNSDVKAQVREANELTTFTRSGRNQFRSPVRPHDAALSAAERRWNKALHDLYSSSPEVYAEVIGVIDYEMQSAATAAEMKGHGAGIAYILEQLRTQGLQRLLKGA
jgi:hypothetical protein